MNTNGIFKANLIAATKKNQGMDQVLFFSQVKAILDILTMNIKQIAKSYPHIKGDI
jgi:hypothetical protein